MGILEGRMDLFTPFIIGIGLSMDCFAVSLATGAISGIDKRRMALVFGIVFGVFQAGMTIAGWALGSLFVSSIAAVDHWIAFVILAVIGGKMVFEGIGGDKEKSVSDIAHPIAIIVLALATSIDALAVGLSFAFLEVEVLVPALIIGVVAFLFSVAGVVLGVRLERILGTRIEILGGLILIAIGARILFEHLTA